MLVSFYVNGNFSSFGEGNWDNNIPQIGAEFHVYLDKGKKMAGYTDGVGKKHIMVVQNVVYEPYISKKEHNEIPYGLCDVKVYLVDKTIQNKSNNID